MISQRDKLWYAFVTKPRHEKKAKSYLEGAGIDHYLPLQKSLNQWKDRKRWVEAPLFPSYIFCQIPFVDRFTVLQLPSIVRIVGFNNEPMPVAASEIDTIHDILSTNLELRVRTGLIKGDLVRIVSGLLMGYEGQIAE
ncbi:MAG: UpxY family transcription antiterminator, partial [Calditrichaeota bacterium]